jgi:CspA family cold shock protein
VLYAIVASWSAERSSRGTTTRAGIWAHFSHIDAEGYRTLATGAAVSFDYEQVPGGQDGYDFRATRILSGQD